MATEKQRFTIERTYTAAIASVWSLWTTKDGFESWWGPGGFSAEVHDLDLRPGGVLRYSMIAVAPEMVAFMTNAGMPTVTEARIIFTLVEPMTRLGYKTVADFIPDVAPYDVDTMVELHQEGERVRMVISFDAMHNDEWSQRMSMGFESQLEKLSGILDPA